MSWNGNFEGGFCKTAFVEKLHIYKIVTTLLFKMVFEQPSSYVRRKKLIF